MKSSRIAALLLPLSIVLSFTFADETVAPAVETVTIEHGDLKAMFRDNSKSPKQLSGLDSLFNIRHAPGFDAFDPDVQGASAGLNFEHIISGHRTPNNKFTPRHGPFTLHQLPKNRSVRLIRRADDDPWKIDSTLTYTVVEPHYIDFEFRCIPRDSTLFGERAWAILFFASYMNDVTDASIRFRGIRQKGGPEEWIAGDAPPGHADWNTGGTYRHSTAAEMTYDADHDFRLNNWSYDWPRYTQPYYYGTAANGMSLMLMFDRSHSEEDEIRFSLFKFKLPEKPRPAWDFQYVIHHVESDKESGFRGRMVWKKFVDEADIRNEFAAWSGSQAEECCN